MDTPPPSESWVPYSRESTSKVELTVARGAGIPGIPFCTESIPFEPPEASESEEKEEEEKSEEPPLSPPMAAPVPRSRRGMVLDSDEDNDSDVAVDTGLTGFPDVERDIDLLYRAEGGLGATPSEDEDSDESPGPETVDPALLAGPNPYRSGRRTWGMHSGGTNPSYTSTTSTVTTDQQRPSSISIPTAQPTPPAEAYQVPTIEPEPHASRPEAPTVAPARQPQVPDINAEEISPPTTEDSLTSPVPPKVKDLMDMGFTQDVAEKYVCALCLPACACVILRAHPVLFLRYLHRAHNNVQLALTLMFEEQDTTTA